MKFPWFTFRGIAFIPASLAGWLILAMALIYSIYAFFIIDGQSHSVSDTMMNWVFRLFLIGLVYSLIGFLSSRPIKS